MASAVIMHRLAILVVGAALSGCVFQADYDGGRIACSDGICPSGRVCRENVCVAADAGVGDGGGDGDGSVDARQEALTCADPGMLAASGGTVAGTTVDRVATITAMCGGFVMNGSDAVYRIELAVSAQLLVDIAGGRKAYVLSACMPAPATPACVSNTLATVGDPLSVSRPAGPSFIVVDDESPSAQSAFTLTVTAN